MTVLIGRAYRQRELLKKFLEELFTKYGCGKFVKMDPATLGSTRFTRSDGLKWNGLRVVPLAKSSSAKD